MYEVPSSNSAENVDVYLTLYIESPRSSFEGTYYWHIKNTPN